MRMAFKTMFRKFRRDEDGNATIEFAIYFTVLFFMLAAGVEIAYINLRHAMLERGLDLAVREIRLSTGHIPSYDDIRGRICDEMRVAEECDANLRLEMVQVDPRDLSAAPTDADCSNSAQPPRPLRSFVYGQDNQLMLLRACLKFKPMMPSTAVGKELNKDSGGYAQLVATAAFVQEPK